MVDSKTRSDILLEEKIAQIDDINFDKIYDIEEFSNKQLENFEIENLDFIDSNISSTQNTSFVGDNVFELELQPNEFLDNYNWNKEEKNEEVVKKQKFSLANKPLFYTFTSIAILLGILFIYNLFVINSLEGSVQAKAGANLYSGNANVSYVVEEENNFIMFENSSKMEIENNKNYTFKDNCSQETNWFDSVCNYVNTIFGGNY